MKMKLKNLFLVGLAAFSLTACSYNSSGIHRNNVQYELGRNDMEFSERKSASASQTKIIGIDFGRLFKAESSVFNSAGYTVAEGGIPIVGSFVNPTQVQNYALYNLLSKEGDGYDFILYPKFTEKSSGIPFIFVKTTATVEARMGKIK